MSWKNLTVGKKIGVGFSVVLALLVVLGIMSYTGVSGIVNDAEEVIEGNKLACNLAQSEVDHLNWINKVSALLTDNKVTSLDVEMDDHKCAFGGSSRQGCKSNGVRVPYRQLPDSDG